jgi:alkanesulfonate monooxygenase SsuD/methylene tetrahydromethanopterin reductase-like flavin-dependent oxidoreductase (luciferase family)
MIEGQEDVSWDEWVAIARACERHGIESLFRSDHYLSVDDPGPRGSLDAWGTLTALAAITTTLRLGTLVSPATFRHPSVLAKQVVTADHVSGGRVEVGIGAGWWKPEHTSYGFPFPPTAERMGALAEQLEILHGHWAEGPFSFAGTHYRLEGLDARPKPVQRPHPRLILGGSAGPNGAALAARWADEYNTFWVGPQEAGERRARIAAACEAVGRAPIPCSVMTGVVIATTDAQVAERLAALARWRGQEIDDDELRSTWLVGTVEEVIERLMGYQAAGIERMMLQHWLHRDLNMIELIGRELAPGVA